MTEPTVVTDRVAFRSAAAHAPPGARVPVELRVDVEDPFRAYRRARGTPAAYRPDAGLVGDPDGGLYLETTGGQSGWGYFAVDPVEHLRANAPAGAIDPGATFALEGTVGNPSPSLAALQGLLDGETLVRGDCSVPYPCGAFGWLSYDLVRELETLPGEAVDDRGLPRLSVGVYDRVAAWEEPRTDGATTTLRITACPRVGGDGGAGVEAAYERGLDRARGLATAALEGDPAAGPPPVDADAATFESDCGREAYADRVRAVKQYVRDGDTFQANVSQRLVAPAAVHPVEVFDALRAVNPAPYSALLEFPAVDLVSASPELLLERVGDRVRTEPIAGTRPRGDGRSADAALERDLRTDEKERAEHAMLVDLERNDLGKVCAYGSVDVEEYRRVDRYSEVMHLVSSVAGRLAPAATLSDAVAATFPGGTITGAPKPRTMEIIDELERTRRGPYTGSIGCFGFDGRATLNIVIRTLVGHAGEYHLRVGAGIVHDSVPDREYEETLDKARALITAVDAALDGRRLDVAAADGAGGAGGAACEPRSRDTDDRRPGPDADPMARGTDAGSGGGADG